MKTSEFLLTRTGVLLLFISLFSQTTPICIEHGPCKLHHHHFYHNSGELDLVLESSSRVSHQVTNHILKVILEDILCFQSVKLLQHNRFNNVNATAVLDRVTGCSPAT
ncbi:hypothetical protein BaRGS_00033761, partial [Batillaria attramentaria]